MNQGRYTRADAVIAAVLAVLTLLLSVGMLDTDHPYGDDFAAYMLEGKAIAEGRLTEQAELNAFIHPSERNFGNNQDEGPIVYVWGLPLILSAVYKVVGFDQPTGYAILWYKLPGVLFLTMTAAAAYLFYRRRFSKGISAMLTALLCWTTEVVRDSAQVTTDIPCLAVSLLALLVVEVLLDARTQKIRLISAVTLGVALWYDCAVRLNGKTVLYVVLAAHAIGLIRQKVKLREALVHALPYVVLGVLWGICRMAFPAATSNTQDIASGPNRLIMQNIGYYNMVLEQWVTSMLPTGFWRYSSVVLNAVYVCILAGVLFDGICRNLHLTVLMLGSFAVLVLLPYVQTLRYLYNALPLLLMFMAYGARTIIRLTRRAAKNAELERAMKAAAYCALAFLTLGTAQKTVMAEKAHADAGGFSARSETYAPDAVDMYAHIMENTAENAVIAYYKPRALLLNTGRVGFSPTVNGHSLSEGQYLLMSQKADNTQIELTPEIEKRLTSVYQSGAYTLYEIKGE